MTISLHSPSLPSVPYGSFSEPPPYYMAVFVEIVTPHYMALFSLQKLLPAVCYMALSAENNPYHIALFVEILTPYYKLYGCAFFL